MIRVYWEPVEEVAGPRISWDKAILFVMPVKVHFVTRRYARREIVEMAQWLSISGEQRHAAECTHYAVFAPWGNFLFLAGVGAL